GRGGDAPRAVPGPARAGEEGDGLEADVAAAAGGLEAAVARLLHHLGDQQPGDVLTGDGEGEVHVLSVLAAELESVGELQAAAGDLRARSHPDLPAEAGGGVGDLRVRLEDDVPV